MAIETIGKYQLHFIAYDASPAGHWDPYVSIFEFDDDAQDFKCILEKHRASEEPIPNYDDAIEKARQVGNALLKQYTH